MDTQGFEQGGLTFRTLLSEEGVDLRTRLVARAELDAAMPADAARVTPEQRRAQLWERFHGILRRYTL